MKKMKRFVAVLLAGIMALAMLTACGGTPSAPVTRDEALEKSVAGWTVELGKGAKLDLTEDATLTAISNKCLPSMVKTYDAVFAKDKQAMLAAGEELSKTLTAAANGKKVAPVDVCFLENEKFTKEALAAKVEAGMSNIQNVMKLYGVEKPAKFGVTVTKQKGYTLILFVISE